MTDTRTEPFLDVATRDAGDDEKPFGHATIKGVLDRALLNREMKLGKGYGKRSQQWENRHTTLWQFLERLCTFQEADDKDQWAFLQGELTAEGPRKAIFMRENFLLAQDCDAGYTIDEILTKIPDMLFYILWTTHSHLKTQTKLSKAGLRIHMKSQGRTGEPTAEDARDFLLWKKSNPALLERATYDFDAHGDCTVTHAPWPRVRIAFLLAKPFAFPDKAARELWSRKYLAFADEIGLVVDECCKDPSRLFYLPCVPKGAKFERDEHEIVIFSGAPLDLDAVKVPRAPEPRKKERQPGSTTAGGSAAQSGGFETAHLARFMATCADTFLAADWLGSIAPGEIRRKLEGGEVDATCPLTGGHDPKNLCFHVMNAKPGDSFNIWCLHDDCKRLSAKPNGKQDRGKYLDALCVKHGIASATELVEWCDEATQAAWAPDRTAAFDEIEEGPGAEPEPDMSVLDVVRAPAPAVPLDCFGSFAPWLEQAAEAKSCPVDYPMANLLPAVAGAIGAKRIAIVGDWWEPAVVWSVSIGDSSAGKSPGADAVMGPLREAEKSLLAGYEFAQADYETQQRVAAIALEKWEQAVDAAAAQNLPPPEKPPEALEPKEPSRPQLVIGDATVESVGQVLSENPHGLIQVADELMVWLDFDRYSGKGSNRGFWIQAYGGRPYRLNRKSQPQPIEIPRCLVNVAGNLVPDGIVLILDVNDGLFARFLHSWPEPRPLVRSGPVSDAPRLVRVLRRLLGLQFDAQRKPIELPLTAEAADAFHVWRVANKAAIGETQGFHASALGKHGGYVLRLALVLRHLWWADGPETPPPTTIGLPEITAAIRLLDTYFAPMLRRVLGERSNTVLDRATRSLARAILQRKADRVNVREIKRKWHVMGLDAKLVDMACLALVEAGWLLPVKAQANNAGGRPAKDWDVNARAHELAAKS